MAFEKILLVFAGALIGGLVNGLTGFGTGLTAMGSMSYLLLSRLPWSSFARLWPKC
jgi:uncharacterized membrane protein YfcA